MEFSFSYLGNMAAVFMKQFENFINLCAKVAFTATTFHTGTFDTDFSHISKSYSKFGLLYEDGSRVVMGVK